MRGPLGHCAAVQPRRNKQEAITSGGTANNRIGGLIPWTLTRIPVLNGEKQQRPGIATNNTKHGTSRTHNKPAMNCRYQLMRPCVYCAHHANTGCMPGMHTCMWYDTLCVHQVVAAVWYRVLANWKCSEEGRDERARRGVGTSQCPSLTKETRYRLLHCRLTAC